MNESFEDITSNIPSNLLSQASINDFGNSTETTLSHAGFYKQFLFVASVQGLFKVGVFIGSYIYLVITPIGLVGNVLTLLVLLRDRGAGQSCRVYMSTLATVDSITLLTGLGGE